MPGYSVMGRMIGRCSELSTFRKFSGLRAQLLLYMQAELSHLEMEIEGLVLNPEMSVFDQCFAALDEPDIAENAALWKSKVAQVEEKLDRYYATLLQTSAVSRLPKPNKRDISFLQRWIDDHCGGKGFLRGIEAGPWKPGNAEDLVLLQDHGEPGDRLAEHLCNRVIPIYHRALGHKIHKTMDDPDFMEVWEYKKEAVVQFGNLLCMLLSAFIPTLSIFVLYFVKNVVARLSAIILFSLLFSVLMTFVVEGKRADVWAATTAFAAVQVVFVGVGTS